MRSYWRHHERPSSRLMKFLVAHIAARRAYAVPAILEKAGLLDRFYTDFCLGKGCGNLVWSARHIFPPFREISGRLLPRSFPPKHAPFARSSSVIYWSKVMQKRMLLTPLPLVWEIKW